MSSPVSTLSGLLRSRGTGYAVAVLGVAVTVSALVPLRTRINPTTVALALLLVVLFVATLWGSRPALVASVLGMFCFNFFFLPPVGTLTVADLENWIELAAFLITAVTVGQLSARARRRAAEAESGHREIERLYEELRTAFERASHAEALRQSERLKSALLDAVTHDLRTPLTSIKASVTTILDADARAKGATALDTEGRRELLEVIDEEADRLNHFVEGLVELARIEAGELQLRRRWGTVDEIIAAAIARSETLVRGHRLVTEVEEELPAVRVDARAVAEVIYTLIDNATKYAPTGTRILVTARRDSNEMINLAVEDEGRGIPAELRERIFDKFFRAADYDGTKGARRPAGMGMGLAIARGIVEAHGGRIWAEEGAGGRGTRIAFTVPVGDEEQPETMNAER